MSNLKISVYKSGKLETTVMIPGKVLAVASRLIPSHILSVLESEGINFEEILKLAHKPDTTGVLVELEQHKLNQKIVISLES